MLLPGTPSCCWWTSMLDSVTWRGWVGRDGLPDLNLSGVLLLDFSDRSSLSMIMFEHMSVHKCTWHQDALCRRSLIDFVVVSADLWPYVLDTGVKRWAELSTDQHPSRQLSPWSRDAVKLR